MSLIGDKLTGKMPFQMGRSPKWTALAKAFIRKNPRCSACGTTEGLTVHHKRPVHLFPTEELIESNWIVLCESKKHGINCHLFVGHRGDFRDYNENVDALAAEVLAYLNPRNT